MLNTKTVEKTTLELLRKMEKITFFCGECREHTDHLIVNNVDSDRLRVCIVCNDVQPDVHFEEQDIAKANANAGSWLDDI